MYDSVRLGGVLGDEMLTEIRRKPIVDEKYNSSTEGLYMFFKLGELKHICTLIHIALLPFFLEDEAVFNMYNSQVNVQGNVFSFRYQRTRSNLYSYYAGPKTTDTQSSIFYYFLTTHSK